MKRARRRADETDNQSLLSVPQIRVQPDEFSALTQDDVSFNTFATNTNSNSTLMGFSFSRPPNPPATVDVATGSRRRLGAERSTSSLALLSSSVQGAGVRKKAGHTATGGARSSQAPSQWGGRPRVGHNSQNETPTTSRTKREDPVRSRKIDRRRSKSASGIRLTQKPISASSLMSVPEDGIPVRSGNSPSLSRKLTLKRQASPANMKILR